MPSLTEEIEVLFNKLQSEEVFKITKILEKAESEDGTVYKKYPSGWKIKKLNDNSLLETIQEGGIYVFWWFYSSREVFDEDYCTREYYLVGKRIIENNEVTYNQVKIELTNEWLKTYKGNIPLYVGKSADNILKRMIQHLHINKTKYEGKATSDQFRRGIERLFADYPNTAELIVNNVGFSFIPLGGEDHVVNRFYLEDYAIGKLKPLFNVDIER